MSKISESTVLPISLIITIVTLSYWVSGVANKADNANASFNKLEMAYNSSETIRSQRDREIIERLTRIETLLENRGK